MSMKMCRWKSGGRTRKRSSGARIAMDSGTENLDATARVVRRIVEFTQRGGAIHVIVGGNDERFDDADLLREGVVQDRGRRETLNGSGGQKDQFRPQIEDRTEIGRAKVRNASSRPRPDRVGCDDDAGGVVLSADP